MHAEGALLRKTLRNPLDSTCSTRLLPGRLTSPAFVTYLVACALQGVQQLVAAPVVQQVAAQAGQLLGARTQKTVSLGSMT